MKRNTSKILNFHVVLKILRNRRLRHKFLFFQNKLRRKKLKSNTLKKVNFPIFHKLSKLKCNTSKILNFHDVLKILRNRRLRHSSFYFFNNFLNMQRVKSNPFKKCQLSYFLLKWQNWTLTREKFWIFVFSLINSLLDD